MSDFNPYVDNGGSCMAITGPDYCIIAADTRLSSGYDIASRNVPKHILLTPTSVLASSGMQADIRQLGKVLSLHIKQYISQNDKQMSTPALAQLLSNTLYYRRFMPYYAFNLLGGLDETGKGVLYTYDAIGSMESIRYTSQGSGSQLIQPVLDAQLKLRPAEDWPSIDRAVAMIKDIFTSCGERDIHTGDFVNILIITRDGVREEKFELKFD
ncbi:hypothetical protein RCL1_005658 [Eukaryota sp. TZLM3-RCL]